MTMSAIDALRTQVRGEVITPADGGYEEARKVYNGMIDKHPAAVVRCSGPEDVTAVVGVARAEGLDLSVRGGAHSAPGFGTNDGGLVIDLGGLQDVVVDPGILAAQREVPQIQVDRLLGAGRRRRRCQANQDPAQNECPSSRRFHDVPPRAPCRRTPAAPGA